MKIKFRNKADLILKTKFVFQNKNMDDQIIVQHLFCSQNKENQVKPSNLHTAL